MDSITASKSVGHACPWRAETVTCMRCGRTIAQEKLTVHPYSMSYWYFNGFCLDRNPHLTEDLFFAYCHDCKHFVSIHEAWEILRAESVRLKLLETSRA